MESYNQDNTMYALNCSVYFDPFLFDPFLIIKILFYHANYDHMSHLVDLSFKRLL